MDIEEQLRDALETATSGGRTGYAVAKAAGLKPEVLYRFARGGDLRLQSAAKLAAVLGLTLAPLTPAAGHTKPETEQPARSKQKRK